MTLAENLKNGYVVRFPGDAARWLERLNHDDLVAQTAELGTTALLVVLDRLSPARASALFVTLRRPTQLAVVEEAAPRLALELLLSLDEDERDELVGALPPDARADLTRLLGFPANAAARLMDRAVATLHRDMTVADAIERVRAARVRRARSAYIVDDDNRLAGRVDMQDLVIAGHDERLEGYVHPITAFVDASAPREEIVEALEQHRTDSVPVIDRDGKLMGVVRYDRLFAAIEDVATADIQKMVGASADEHALSAPSFSVKRRLPWLHINLLTAFLAASVVGLFENVIAQFTALAVLLPVVAGQSGNAGSQALAVTIRGLALREIGTREWRRVLSKEVVVGMVNGVVLAITCGAGVYLWSGSFGLALVIAISMVLSIVAAGISGALVPVILTRVGQDPATASSIILTTVTDVAGFFSFLGTATALTFLL